MFLIARLTSAIAAKPSTICRFPNQLLKQHAHGFVSKSHSHIDRSRVPRLDENVLEERFVRGSGPGGQVVNKTSNAVVLRHVPTNLVVKCHAGRSLDQNRKEARRLMVQRLDVHWNGENSVVEQELRLERSKAAETQRRRRRTDEMKRAWREREATESADATEALNKKH